MKTVTSYYSSGDYAKESTKEVEHHLDKDYLFRLCFTVPQEQFLEYIQEVLHQAGIDASEIDGNLVYLTDSTKPIFSAHLDIVGNDFSNPLVFKGNTVKRQGAILGADDRAGVYAILKNIHKIDNFILCRDEEIGAVGSKVLIKIPEFTEQIAQHPCVIVLDRKGNSDIISTNNSYCEKDLVEAVQIVLPNYSVATGSFSDANSFREYVPCVNLSVGYYSAHSANEYLNIEEFLYIVSKIGELNGIEGEFELGKIKTYNYPSYSTKTSSKPKTSYKKSYWEDDDSGADSYYDKWWKDSVSPKSSTKTEVCVFCGKAVDKSLVATYNKKHACHDCLTDIFMQESYL